VLEALALQLEMAQRGDRDAFIEWMGRQLPGDPTADNFLQAAPRDQQYLGLERYLAKRAEAA
jgi:hypothetical protein